MSGRPTEFVITCQGRDGSHLLLYALGIHPDIHVVNEPFGDPGRTLRARLPSPDALVGFLFERRALAAGFPLQFYHGRRKPFDGLREHLVQRRVKVIHLERENRLRRFLSLELARQTQTFIDHDGSRPTQATTAVDVEKMLGAFWQTEAVYGGHRATFAACESIDVRYEDLCTRFDETIDVVLDFLGVPRMQLAPQTHRQERRPLKAIIQNYAEVESALKGTIYERYLDPEPKQ